LEDRFTEEELQIAKSVDLIRVAESLGFTPKRVGNYYTLKEMDSIRIYDRSNWFRWSRQFEKGQNGGSQIDFLRVFAGMDVKTAVFWLLDFSGYRRMEEKESFYHLKNQVEKKEPIKKKPFVLPRPSDKNLYLYQYLQKERGLRKEVIDYFLEKGLIYESQYYHNIVFKGNASDGTTKFASMRGVFDRNRKPFKCDVAGNDKNYGFNVANKESSIVIVFEGAIDLLSYVDLFDDYESNKIALGMISDAPLETFLKENPQVRTIYFCLDNDEAGRKAVKVLLKKYYELGYEVEDIPPPGAYKDYNEWLVSERLGQKCYEKVLAKL
jgi:hypothetical protein